MTFDANKLQAAATIIKQSALEFLAEKHGCTVEAVVLAIRAGDREAMAQFAALVKAAVDEAEALAKQGRISFE